MPVTAVVGCGNPNRTDDGAGPRVIALLRGRPLAAEVALYDAGTDGMAVMYRAQGAGRLIIVDARAPEAAPGAIYEVAGEVLEAPPQHGFGLHDFRWDHALYAGRRIYGQAFPTDVTVILIEAASVDLGLGLTAAVEAAAQRVADRIEAMTAADAVSACIDVRAGTVHLPAAVADRYFRGVEAVVVLIGDGALEVLPVRRVAAGGCLLKLRNAAGDRVVSAPDVFHANGLGDWVGQGLEASWSQERAALRVRLPEN